MKKIVFATHNTHKLSEIREIVDRQFKILGLSDIGCNEEIPETGATLQENALQKALYIKKKYGYDCFADDTGLEVDVLGGAPGVHTARYAGDEENSEENMSKMLQELKGETRRTARFKTVIALLQGEKQHFFKGIAEGEIVEERRGTYGFGYDPIFAPQGYSKTFAEMEDDEKNKISHRAIAVEQLIGFLLS